MAYTREQVLLGAFVAVEGAHAYSAFLPSIMTIRKFADDETAVLAIRQGEVIATGFAVALGWIVGELTDSHLPMLFAFGVSVMMLTVYEFALRGRMGAGTAASAVGLAASTVIPGIPPFP